MSTRSHVVQPDDYFASIWATNVIDGTLYGVPWYVDTRLLFYRTDLLARAGFDAPPRDLGRVAAHAGRAQATRSAHATASCCRPTNTSS